MKRNISLAILAFSVVLLLAGCNEKATNVDQNENSDQIEEEEVKEEPNESEEPKIEGPTSPTTGLSVSENDGANNFAVMVENSPGARPQTGLVAADVVYEMEVEGNVTRFLTIFNDNTPKKIGPVRSSRHYYLPIAESWNVPYIHFGGSPQAYAKLDHLSVPTIDGIYQSKFFKRDNSRIAPHNTYLYANQLDTFEQELVNEKFEFKKNPSYKNASTSTTLDITYNDFTQVTYAYDADTNLYNRYLEGKPHEDRETGKQIKASNVIVVYAAHNLIPGDQAGRINITLTGEGEAEFFLNGQVVKGKWKNEEGNLRFYADNNIVSLTPGKTWIQVVDAQKKNIVSY